MPTGFDPFGQFKDSLRIAVPLIMEKNRLAASKQAQDQLFQQRAMQLVQQAELSKQKFAADNAMKIFEETAQSVNPEDPDGRVKLEAAASNLERIMGQPIIPRDETGNMVLSQWGAKKPQDEYEIKDTEQGLMFIPKAPGKQPIPVGVAGRQQKWEVHPPQPKEDKPQKPSHIDLGDRVRIFKSDGSYIDEPKGSSPNKNEQGTKPKQGYMWNDDRSAQVPIPGSEADKKQKLQYSKEKYAFESVTTDLDRLVAEASAVKDHPGLNGITGITGKFPNIPGGQAANAQARLDSLKSQIFINVLGNMRKQSATGGAVGNVTEREGDKLEAALGSLNNAQSAAELKNALQRIMDYSNTIKTKLGEAFSTWDEIIQPQGAQIKPQNLDLKSIPNDELIKRLNGAK